jgi:hypothetical protein
MAAASVKTVAEEPKRREMTEAIARRAALRVIPGGKGAVARAVEEARP